MAVQLSFVGSNTENEKFSMRNYDPVRKNQRQELNDSISKEASKFDITP